MSALNTRAVYSDNASLSRVTAPAATPLTLAELKLHTRYDDDQTVDNALLMMYQDAVVSLLEGDNGILGRALITQTWDLKLDQFPYGSTPIRPKLSPLQSVSSITYVDENGNTQTWAASNYTVDTATEPGRIEPAYGVAYPATRYQHNAVTVRFVAGYGSFGSDVPEAIRLAIAIWVSHFYEVREPIVTGTIVAQVPDHLNSLINAYRLNWLR